MVTRRMFLKSSGLAFLSLGFAPTFLARIAEGEPSRRGKILVTIFQRGAADGLNIVVPFGDKHYYDLRPTIAIPPPSAESELSALDLDGFFGLHPALRPLLNIYKSGHLAVVHAAGSPDNTRSHFDAQDYMESATPGVKSTPDGWLNRYLLARPEKNATPFRAVSMTATLPRTLQGSAPAVALENISAFTSRVGPASAQLQENLRALYASSGSRLLRDVGMEAFEAMDFLQKTVTAPYQPAAGAAYPRSPLGRSLQQVAQLIKADAGVEVAFAETGGWDHHANEGGVQGQLASRLTDLAAALAAFHVDMGDRMSDIVVLTMSEFGRTAHENGNRGTDHGHANVMFVLGGPVQGGKVYGEWPGVAPEQLNEGRDLALTTDFRDVFGEIVQQHLSLKSPATVFPNFKLDERNFRGFLKT